MNSQTFNKLLDELDGNSLETLKQKNAKYASDNDCLHNFEMGAEIMGSTPAQCAWGYLTKHLVALRDKVERDDFSDREDFLEKCQDIINYIRFIWVIGNAQEGYVALDKFDEYLKHRHMEEDDDVCENCQHQCDEFKCRTCTADCDVHGNTTSLPSNFEARDGSIKFKIAKQMDCPHWMYTYAMGHASCEFRTDDCPHCMWNREE